MIRACSPLLKDPTKLISELENDCEALENAIEEIREATWEPKTTLPRVKRQVAKILVGLKRNG